MSNLKRPLKTIATLDILALGTMYAINRMIASSSVLNNMLKVSQGHYYHWKYGRVFYRKSGSGSPLVLIHDLDPSSSGYEWSQIENRLAESHTVYVLDLPGCGRSDKPRLTYTNYFYVLLLEGFLKDVVKAPADLAATGLSSTFALMTSGIAPSLVDHILMINPPSLSSLKRIPDDKSRFLRFLLSCPILGTTLYYIITNRTNTEYQFTERWFYNPFHVSQKMTAAYYEAAHRGKGDGKFLKYSLDGNYLNVDIRRALAQRGDQITIIFGDHLENAIDLVASYQKFAPGMKTVSIPNVGKLPQLEAPAAFLTEIKMCLPDVVS